MKLYIEKIIQAATAQLKDKGILTAVPPVIQVDIAKDKDHGDFASNIALVLAKVVKKNPRELAQAIVADIKPDKYIEKIEIAGPGFINFFLSPNAFNKVILEIHHQKEHFGHSTMGQGKKIIVEFLSSNPTGPLHVGHGRLAAFGSVIGNLLSAVGFKPYCEYYINDAGRQMDIITLSVWIHYLNLCGESVPFPANGYKGDYVKDIAKKMHLQMKATLVKPKNTLLQDLPFDEVQGGDKDLYIDAMIVRANMLLAHDYQKVLDFTLNNIMEDIKNDLSEFGVHYDNWFSEREFIATGIIDKLLEKLRQSGHVYQRDGALWFRATDFNDAKDRVLVRSNGQRTYFANDVGYHLNKFERGFDIALDIFGSDHHGYTSRMKAAMAASGINSERLLTLLVQFVKLYRGGVQIPMSTREGNFITLRELRQEVGNDATRFFYVMRKAEQHVDFDLELAKAKSNENPVYYVQYAHARICSVFKQLSELSKNFDLEQGLASLHLLVATQERDLINSLSRYPEVVIKAALNYEPHILTHFLREVATHFHAYYTSLQFLVADETLRNARLALISATRIVLVNGFNLLGISAPETM